MLSVQQQKFYSKKTTTKKQPQKKSQKKGLETILENNSDSDDNNNIRSNEAEQISKCFDGLNIADNHQSNNHPTTENAPAKVPLTIQLTDSANMNESSLLDDSLVLIEPKIEVIELLDDSFENTISSMNFSALSTDDPTDEECEDAKKDNSKIAWSNRMNVRSIVIQQEHIKQKVVDTLFGRDPMTVDLFDIFPDIEPELTVRRRSSVYWTTPPRYSMLPKY